MPLTPEDLIAREEIRDALNAYSHGLDQRNWEIYARAWTPDAMIFAPGPGSADPVSADEFRTRLITANDATRLSGQHLLNNTWFQIDGDTAHTVTEFTWVTLQTTDKPDLLFEVRGGGLYVDDLRRTDQGWRISTRRIAVKNRETRGVPYAPELIDSLRRTLETDWYL